MLHLDDGPFWHHVLQVSRVVKDVEQLETVKRMLRAHACLIREAFRYYASFSVIDPFSIGFNVFTDFRCGGRACVRHTRDS